uniref:Uncharacterized protein n=1 Tax=Arundo donax TaxID=35708 RepID=A0A0A9I1Y1_ARUDO
MQIRSQCFALLSRIFFVLQIWLSFLLDFLGDLGARTCENAFGLILNQILSRAP